MSSMIRDQIEQLIGAVPGLAHFLDYFLLPGSLSAFFQATLAITLFASVAWVMLRRSDVREWSDRKARRFVVGSFVAIIGLLFLGYTARETVISSHTYPDGESTLTLVPAVMAWTPGRLEFPYQDCTENPFPCTPGQIVNATSAADVTNLISLRGIDAVIIRGGFLHVAWVGLLLLFFISPIALLVVLFGVVVFRNAHIGSFLEAHLPQRPAPQPAQPVMTGSLPQDRGP